MISDDLVVEKRKTNAGTMLLDWFLVLCIFSLYAGSITPDVNESHYWVKAKNFWNPDFAGRDLFVQSKDAHWFFFATFGVLTQFFPLPVATWFGRILGWSFLSFGWCYFVRRYSTLRLPGVLSAGLWIACMHWGHLSGEWVVGGCEAKVFAYAAAFIGLACVLDREYGWSWIWMGVASAFHVLTGAWLVVATMVVLGIRKAKHRRFNLAQQINDTADSRSQFSMVRLRWLEWGGLVLGGMIALLGLIPALALNAGVGIQEKEQGAIIYVFQRLPHHLVPSRFALERWWSFGTLLTIAAALYWFVSTSLKKRRNTGQTDNLHDRYKLLGELSIVFLLIAAAGVAIDFGLSGWATNWSATLLRYYWFRWNDVVWPVLIVVSLTLIMDGFFNSSVKLRSFAILGLILPAVVVIGTQYFTHYRDTISPADQSTLLLRSDVGSARNIVHRDWLDMCAFIHSNTPKDSLFLTPRFQQTFKWNASRAEVVCWKDSPQDALGLIEWESRLLAVFPSDTNGYGMPWSDRLLAELGRKYDFDYVLIDRRIQKTPPVLEFIQSNSTYGLFRVIKLVSETESSTQK